MRWRTTDLFEWHPWFAWRPVYLEGKPNDYVWLERLERKYYGDGLGGHWAYRLPCSPDFPTEVRT